MWLPLQYKEIMPIVKKSGNKKSWDKKAMEKKSEKISVMYTYRLYFPRLLKMKSSSDKN